MLIGIPKEIKDHEYRVGATPNFVKMLTDNSHEVLVEERAGALLGFTDQLYEDAGATIVQGAAKVYDAEMIIKVKEPQDSEFPLIKEGQIIFGFFHLAPDPKQTANLVKQKAIAIAYETVTDDFKRLPLLVPMSEIAGRVSVQAGATALQMANGGRGVLLGGVPGVDPAKVCVIGGGIAGTEAARMAMGLGAEVVILDSRLDRLRQLDHLFGPRLKTLYSDSLSLEKSVVDADLVIGAVLLPGKKAPKLVTREHILQMKQGAVIADIAIDQGGCCETSKPTTHSTPTYEVNGVIHYCVTNMPGACALTATHALAHATMKYALSLANMGVEKALKRDVHLMNGLNLWKGSVTSQPVAEDLGYEFTDPVALF